jgi:hypothetical protein
LACASRGFSLGGDQVALLITGCDGGSCAA